MMERSCATCRYNLGGGYNNCRINLEAECAAGEYEAWEPKDGKTANVRGFGGAEDEERQPRDTDSTGH